MRGIQRIFRLRQYREAGERPNEIRVRGRLSMGAWSIATLATLALVLSPAAAVAQERIELEGPISAVNGTEIELYGGLVKFQASGAEIETDDENFRNISDLKPGTDLEVDATIRPDGTIAAARVEVSDEKDPDTELGGVISSVDEAAGTFSIGPVKISFDGSTKLKDISAIQAGTLVEVTLDISSGRLRALLVEREEADD